MSHLVTDDGAQALSQPPSLVETLRPGLPVVPCELLIVRRARVGAVVGAGQGWEAQKNKEFSRKRLCARDDNLCALEAFFEQYQRWAALPGAYDMHYEVCTRVGRPLTGAHPTSSSCMTPRLSPRRCAVQSMMDDELAELARLKRLLGLAHVPARLVRHGLQQVLINRRTRKGGSLWDRNRTAMHAEHIAHPRHGEGAARLSSTQNAEVERRLGAWMAAKGYLQGEAGR